MLADEVASPGEIAAQKDTLAQFQHFTSGDAIDATEALMGPPVRRNCQVKATTI